MNPHNTKKTAQGQSTAQGNSIEMQGIFLFWKNAGETLAVMLRRFREEQGLGESDKLTYAGRLDPMAEGIVPILSGEARFQKDHLMGASKTYEVDILLGIGTDTADLLGLLTHKDLQKKADPQAIAAAAEALSRVTELAYPNYSSRPVEGKPLFMHARAGKKVTAPIKSMTIGSLELVETREVFLRDILEGAIETIQKVQGDFRQAETLEQWRRLQAEEGGTKIQTVSIRATVSSGTYMRALAEKMGALLGVPALAAKIVRTSVGGK